MTVLERVWGTPNRRVIVRNIIKERSKRDIWYVNFFTPELVEHYLDVFEGFYEDSFTMCKYNVREFYVAPLLHKILLEGGDNPVMGSYLEYIREFTARSIWDKICEGTEGYKCTLKFEKYECLETHEDYFKGEIYKHYKYRYKYGYIDCDNLELNLGLNYKKFDLSKFKLVN